jgi:hypothetical protein
MPKANTDGPEMRTTDGGDRISVELLRIYLTWVLSHDVVSDKVHDLVFDHVVGGHLHPTVAATSLRQIVSETIDAATDQDWQVVFDALVSDAREAAPELGAMPASESSRFQQLKEAARRYRAGRG